jgi:hypothetical protein
VGTGVIALVTSTALQGAFLAPLPTISETGKTTSPYVDIIKTASAPEQTNTLPVDNDYTITIQPKDNYAITITGATDELDIKFISNSAGGIKEPVDLSTQLLLPLTIEPGGSKTLTYHKKFGIPYMNSRVTNNIKIDFTVIEESGEIGTHQASTAHVFCFGNCPKEEKCWPAKGYVAQEPYGKQYCDNYFKPYGELFTHCNGGVDRASYWPDAYDIIDRLGTPVKAIQSGTVKYVQLSESGFGWHLQVDGDNSILYGHFSRIDVKADDYVNQGDQLGLMGHTGYSDGDHVHIEVLNSAVTKGTDDSVSILRGWFDNRKQGTYVIESETCQPGK